MCQIERLPSLERARLPCAQRVRVGIAWQVGTETLIDKSKSIKTTLLAQVSVLSALPIWPTVHADPGGSLPNWLVNSIVIETPLETLMSMHAKIHDQKYQGQSYAFMNEEGQKAVVEAVAATTP